MCLEEYQEGKGTDVLGKKIKIGKKNWGGEEFQVIGDFLLSCLGF